MRDLPAFANRREPMLLAALLALTLLLRTAAFLVLSPPVESDGAAYLMLADSFWQTGVPTDMFGQHGFYSIGYPLALLPFVMLFGATAQAALLTNLLLSALTLWLLWQLARQIGLPAWARLLVAAIYATWLPGIWNAAMVARENLSTPLLLAILLTSLSILQRKRGASVIAGALCGGAMLAGGSALLLCLAPLTAIWLAANRRRELIVRSSAMLASGLLLVLAPWLLAMQAMTGSMTLNTSSGFNFYLGHNAAATGRYVSIADTPYANRWEALRLAVGEAEAGAVLAREGRAFIAANSTRTAELVATKLALFWTPNVPDATDFAASKMLALIRIAEVAQYLLLLLLGGYALLSGRVAREQRRVILAVIVGFWVVHAAAYVMPRYRDPVMPVVMLLAVAAIARRGVQDGR
jgi:hypothetical protein